MTDSELDIVYTRALQRDGRRGRGQRLLVPCALCASCDRHYRRPGRVAAPDRRGARGHDRLTPSSHSTLILSEALIHPARSRVAAPRLSRSSSHRRPSDRLLPAAPLFRCDARLCIGGINRRIRLF